MMSTLVAVAILIASEDMPEDQFVPRSFVIVKATPDYREAHRFATKAARRLSVGVNPPNLARGGDPALTWLREPGEEGFGDDPPWYFARGRGDDGVYLSIEVSDHYPGFTRGLYIVVLASGSPNDPTLNTVLRRARTTYPTATMKTAPVYMGCMH